MAQRSQCHDELHHVVEEGGLGEGMCDEGTEYATIWATSRCTT